MAYLSNQCFAYNKLKRQIGQQCFIYRKLSETGELGSMPGMYQRTDDDRCIPGESASAFLRGGVITTMACFEAFLHDLLDEAKENIKYRRKDHEGKLSEGSKHSGGDCLDCQNLKYKHIFNEKDERKKCDIDETHNEVGPMLHSWNSTYSKTLGLAANDPSNDFIKQMQLVEFPMNYYYLLDDKKISKIEIKDASIICLFLRLFYGIRCVMAHGSSDKTFQYPGALAHFPNCAECINPSKIKEKREILGEGKKTYHKKNEELKDCAKEILDQVHSIDIHTDHSCCECVNEIPSILKNTRILSDVYNECIKEQGKCKVLKTARKFPNKKPIENLRQKITRDKGLNLIDKIFLNKVKQPEVKTCNDKTDTGANEEDVYLGKNYAFFHLCRIHHWLEEDEREAYVTYNMLVRINQFILLLAHRMRFAVARHMMVKYKLRPGIWNVPDNWKDKIEKFEKKHRKHVLDLQKPVSTGTKFCTVFLNK